jgi:hypothetical protein
MVYAPAGVPAGTLTVPVAGSSVGTGPPPIGVAGVTTVPAMSAGFTATPLSVSLA